MSEEYYPEDYSPEFLEEMRQALEGRRSEIINRSHLARNTLQERDKLPGDSVDESTDEQGTSTQLRLSDRERNLLPQINHALDRIEDGDYGYCEECGEPIGEARLRARPMAILCIEDQERREKEERRRHAKRPGMFKG